MKKITLILLMVLISAAFVSAINSMEKNNGPYDARVYLYEGWNIIAGTNPLDGIKSDSEIKIDNILATWYYSPIQQKYIQVYPNPDDDLYLDDDDFVLTNAMWVYSDTEGELSYSTLEDYPELGSRQIYSGWNFVSITPDMFENNEWTIDSIKGTCELEKAYFYFSQENPPMWADFTDKTSMTLDDDFVGNGIVIRAASNCQLGKAASASTTPAPPTMPS